MDPVGLVTSILDTTSAILQWYLDRKAKEPALVDLRSTVELLHFAVMSPLLERSRDPTMPKLDQNIAGSLQGLRVLISTTHEHLQLWEAKSSSSLTWDAILALWKPSIVLDDIRSDEQRIFKSAFVLTAALTTQIYARLSIPNFAAISQQQGRHETSAAPTSSSDAVSFWERQIGRTSQFCSLKVFCEALRRDLGSPINDEARTTLGLVFDPYGVGGITRTSFETVLERRSLRQTIHQIYSALSTNKSYKFDPTSPGILVWVDDCPDNNRKRLEYARSLGLQVYTFTSTIIAKNWIQSQMDLLRKAERACRLQFISDYTRPENDHAMKTVGMNTSAGEVLLRYLRGQSFLSPFLIHTSRTGLAKTTFVAEYANAGSCSTRNAVVTEYIKSLTTGIDDRWWQDYAVKPLSETQPLLVWVHDNPNDIPTYLEHAASLKLDVEIITSTIAADKWIATHTQLIRRLSGVAMIRFITNNSRLETFAEDSTGSLKKVRNNQAGQAFVKSLRGHGCHAPVLVFTRNPVNTTWVKDDQNAGSTMYRKVVMDFLSALSNRSTKDNWWRDFLVKPLKATPPVLVVVDDRPNTDEIKKILDHAQKKGVHTVVLTSDLLARLWPEAAGLAWLGRALAQQNRRPGQSRQIRLALAWLWLEPRLGAGGGGKRRAASAQPDFVFSTGI